MPASVQNCCQTATGSGTSDVDCGESVNFFSLLLEAVESDSGPSATRFAEPASYIDAHFFSTDVAVSGDYYDSACVPSLLFDLNPVRDGVAHPEAEAARLGLSLRLRGNPGGG